MVESPAVDVEAGITPLVGLMAHFVPEATSAVWDGEVLTVTFREAGLVADAVTTVSITGEAAADAVCAHRDKVLFSLHSHSAVVDESAYRATSGGLVDSTVMLRLAAQVAAVDGVAAIDAAAIDAAAMGDAGADGCGVAAGTDGDGRAMEVNHSFSVTIRDLDTGAAMFLSGVVAPTR